MRTNQLKQTTENNGGPLVRQKAMPGVLTKHQHVTSWEWERVAQIQDKAYMPLYDFSFLIKILFFCHYGTPLVATTPTLAIGYQEVCKHIHWQADKTSYHCLQTNCNGWMDIFS